MSISDPQVITMPGWSVPVNDMMRLSEFRKGMLVPAKADDVSEILK